MEFGRGLGDDILLSRALQWMLIDRLLHPSRLCRCVALDTCCPDFGKVRVDVHGRMIRWIMRLDHGGEGLRVPVRGCSLMVGGHVVTVRG